LFESVELTANGQVELLVSQLQFDAANDGFVMNFRNNNLLRTWVDIPDLALDIRLYVVCQWVSAPRQHFDDSCICPVLLDISQQRIKLANSILVEQVSRDLICDFLSIFTGLKTASDDFTKSGTRYFFH
jgi:hypothetical protein